MVKGKRKGSKGARADSGKAKRLNTVGVYGLTGQSLMTIKRFWRPLGGIMLVYLVLHIIFASGLTNLSSNINDIRSELSTSNDRLGTAVGGFLVLSAGSGASDSGAAQLMQTVLIVAVSLVIIWALRQLLAGNNVSVKQAFYHGMAPLVPFLLVLVVIIIHLLPVLLGSVIVNVVLNTVFIPSALVSVLSVIMFVTLAAWSLYLLSSSLLALYIVTLPDMQPLAALRSAKNLVRFRRWRVAARVLFLPVFGLLVMAGITLPVIIFAPFLILPIFYLLSAMIILYSHTYMYNLYRSLL